MRVIRDHERRVKQTTSPRTHGPLPALILAFDGVVADTLGLRADGIAEALRDDQIDCDRAEILASLPGRSLYEAVDLLTATTDTVLIELATLRAQQWVSIRMAQGVVITEFARTMLSSAATGTRIVLRADSQRRDVEPLLRLADLDDAFTFVRCSDDAPRLPGATSLESSYAEISRRLDVLRVSAARSAIETDHRVAVVARHYVGQVHVEPTVEPTPVPRQ